VKLYKALDIDLENWEVVSIVGGGGKTSTIFKLAKELSELGRKVLVTTTTAIMMPEKDQYDTFLNLSNKGDIDRLFESKPGTVTVLIGDFIRADKLKGIDEELVDKIYERCYFDNILVEADGSRMKPIKAPREGEPLLPSTTKKLVGVIGLDALGKKADEETVHRLELFKEVTGVADGEIIGIDAVSKLILHNRGLFKGSELNDVAEKYLLLNKADDEKLKAEAERIAERVAGKEEIKKVIIASLKAGEISVW
jgi:probable selenium-dependent hydroxylase accessory protein YqeC